MRHAAGLFFLKLAVLGLVSGAVRAEANQPMANSASAAMRLEQQQLQAQRMAVEARAKQQSLQCEQRFFVNACLDGVRAQRLREIEPIQRREQQIDGENRQLRADAQKQRVAERERDAATTEARLRSAELLATPPATKLAGPGRPRGAAQPGPTPQAQVQTIQAKQQVADREAKARVAQRLVFERQQAAHQRELKARAESRAAKDKKPAPALPVPSAAEIAKLGASRSSSAASAGQR